MTEEEYVDMENLTSLRDASDCLKALVFLKEGEKEDYVSIRNTINCLIDTISQRIAIEE